MTEVRIWCSQCGLRQMLGDSLQPHGQLCQESEQYESPTCGLHFRVLESNL